MTTAMTKLHCVMRLKREFKCVSIFKMSLIYKYPFAKIPGISSVGKGRLKK